MTRASRLLRVGGAWAIGVSLSATAWTVGRGVAVNPLVAWTLVTAAAGGVLALGGGRSPDRWSLPSALLIAVGAVPAAFSIGVLYLPAIVATYWAGILREGP